MEASDHFSGIERACHGGIRTAHIDESNRTTTIKAAHQGNLALAQRAGTVIPDGDLSARHQYTRFFGLMYAMSSVSVYSWTGR